MGFILCSFMYSSFSHNENKHRVFYLLFSCALAFEKIMLGKKNICLKADFILNWWLQENLKLPVVQLKLFH